MASYDFVIPVSINHTVAPTPAPSTFPPTPAPSHMNWTISELMTPAPSLVDVATPSRRVLATALRPPLQLSHSILEFRLPSGYFELGIESGAGRAPVYHSVLFRVLCDRVVLYLNDFISFEYRIFSSSMTFSIYS